ncbi:6-phospho-beta-glucosidase [Falsibacillus albus]|uniref:6-phospho-beta-glucosidase n=1 Tax=Falsibacillus albus TaxID=2478915 RepID=A0A3L7K2D5_9BACI|nr:6-phospho-beta-glucosidase [Falsibacillus albus]RLQ94852.1 6-phospho-beta-glucosidase [Falsibacillus albus]
MSGAGLKIVTIGGGSSYTPELIEGFIKRYEDLPVKELWLVDIEEGAGKLKIIGDLAKRMVKKAGVQLEIHLTLNREEALKGADFVTTQFRVGFLEARAKDERIPLKYGVIGQETNGPGGLFKALRTIPVILQIAEEMERLCPDAWLINFTNPAGIVTEAVLRYSHFKKVIGLCNIPIGMKMKIASFLGESPEDIQIDFAGLNHMVFGLNVYRKGENITKDLIEMKSGGEESGMSVKNIEDIPWEPEFLKGLGIFPCPYHRYYYQTSKMLEEEMKASKEKGVRAEVVKQIEEELFKEYQNVSLDVKPPQLEKRGGAYYSDAACSLIDSIYNNRGDVQTVNTKNNGAISSLPRDSAVEINCIITKDGPKPIAIGDLPVSVRGLVQQIKSFERLTAEAATTGDYQTALVAMTINPLVPSDTLAKVILDEMLEAHKEYLPQFHRKVN